VIIPEKGETGETVVVPEMVTETGIETVDEVHREAVHAIGVSVEVAVDRAAAVAVLKSAAVTAALHPSAVRELTRVQAVPVVDALPHQRQQDAVGPQALKTIRFEVNCSPQRCDNAAA